MRPRLASLSLLVALAAMVMLSCNGGGETPDGSTTPPTDGTPAVPTIPVDPGEATPTGLAEARERLTGQLDAIGANIGAVPDDIREQLLERCEVLKQFADDGDVEPICQTIDQAIDTNDPGLIDRVLDQLAGLEED